MAPTNGENGETPKGGWFDRVKSRFFGGQSNVAAETAAEAAGHAGTPGTPDMEAVATPIETPPAPPELAIEAIPDHEPPLPLAGAADLADTVPVEPGADIADETAVEQQLANEPLLASPAPEPEAPLAPSEPTVGNSSPYLDTPHLPTGHADLGPLDPGVLAGEAEAARTLPIEPGPEPTGGSWLDRFKGRFGLGLGTPQAIEAPPETVAVSEMEEIEETVAAEIASAKQSWFSRLATRLSETREGFVNKVNRLTKGKSKIDEDMLDELEEILLTSDVGPKTTDEILAFLRQKAKQERFYPDEVLPALREYLAARLAEGAAPISANRNEMTIFLMVGVNGVGKTTTTGKIAAKFRLNDYKVLLAAADTFRAGAIDQLQVWGERAGVDVIRHGEGGDAAAVVYDAIKSAQARQAQILIVDTAGRLHTKHNLMEELAKIRRIIDREAPDAKVESLLVLDATTGQNGLRQAEVFSQATPLTGVILTKLDGTAKGGVVFGIRESLNLPIRLMGVGEGLEDLREFDPQLFVEALFTQPEDVART